MLTREVPASETARAGEFSHEQFVCDTILTLRIPARHIEAQARWREEATDQKPGRGEKPRGGRVLLIDDSTDTLAVIKAMTEQAGYEVETADSVDAALEAARRFAPDAVLSDIGMPGADGFEFLKRLREEAAFAGVPVIALTGYASLLDREAALSAGFAADLAKPVEPRVLVTALEEILNDKK